MISDAVRLAYQNAYHSEPMGDCISNGITAAFAVQYPEAWATIQLQAEEIKQYQTTIEKIRDIHAQLQAEFAELKRDRNWWS